MPKTIIISLLLSGVLFSCGKNSEKNLTGTFVGSYTEANQTNDTTVIYNSSSMQVDVTFEGDNVVYTLTDSVQLPYPFIISRKEFKNGKYQRESIDVAGGTGALISHEKDHLLMYFFVDDENPWIGTTSTHFYGEKIN